MIKKSRLRIRGADVVTKALIDLSKKAKISLEKKGIFNEKVNVALVLDISASMTHLYNRGIVQDIVDRILAVGMNLDANEEIDVYLFGRHAHRLGAVGKSNIEGYVRSHVLKKYEFESSTYYAEVARYVAEDFVGYKRSNKVLDAISNETGGIVGKFKKLFGSKEPVATKEEVVKSVSGSELNDATLVFFVTDGDNHDKDAMTEFMRDVSGKSIFWQFIGIGDAGFNYLESLDEMEGREIDNANFFELNDLRSISDSVLYDRILGEFPSWLKESRRLGITK